MNILVFGTGYVGLVVGSCLAETGNDASCADIARSGRFTHGCASKIGRGKLYSVRSRQMPSLGLSYLSIGQSVA